jgi:soluble cytochrome b562
MKISILLLTSFLGLLVLPVAVLADDTPLAKQMEAMNDAYKAFRREKDPAKGAALAREAQDAALKGIPEVPELVQSMAAGEAKAKAIVAYRKSMGQLFITLCQVEEAFLANDLDKVAELVETLKDIKKEGHDQFMDEE